jgi:hypothetical protein
MLKKLSPVKKALLIAVLIFVAAVALEVLVFSFRCISTSKYEPFSPQKFTLGSGVTQEGDIYTFTQGEQTISFDIAERQLKNLYINPQYTGTNHSVKFEMLATDAANTLPFKLNTAEVFSDEERSRYITLHLSGKSNCFILKFDLPENTQLSISGIQFNAPVPFSQKTSAVRLFAILFIFYLIFAVYLLRKKLAKPVLSCCKRKLLLSTSALIVFIIISLIAVDIISPDVAPALSQYQKLARSMKSGSVSLQMEIPEALTKMENPYDTNLREQLLQEENATVWDAAYYKGHLYAYFGVVPVILLYLPYHIITGGDLPDMAVHSLFLASFVVAVFFLLYQIIKKKFSGAKLWQYYALCILVLLGNSSIICLERVYTSLARSFAHQQMQPI